MYQFGRHEVDLLLRRMNDDVRYYMPWNYSENYKSLQPRAIERLLMHSNVTMSRSSLLHFLYNRIVTHHVRIKRLAC